MKRLLKNLVRFVIGLFIAFLLLLLLFDTNSTTISGASMHPTYGNNEIVNYTKVENNNININRYDIVHYTFDVKSDYPDFELDSNCPKILDKKAKCYNGEPIYYIKRVIGMPGDTIEIKNNKVYVNGKDEGLQNVDFSETIVRGMEQINKENKNRSYIYKKSPNGYYVSEIVNSNYGMQDKKYGKVGEDEYFVLGDSRNNSIDSRAKGNVQIKRIKGVSKSPKYK